MVPHQDDVRPVTRSSTVTLGSEWRPHRTASSTDRSAELMDALIATQQDNFLASWDLMTKQASVLIKSGFLPQAVKTAEQAIAIMMMGDALGVAHIVALNTINVIQGKPTVSPQLMLALVRRSGQLETFRCTDDGSCCTVIMKRKGEPEHRETFSMADANAMQLSSKDNWKKQPATMRKWRAI